MLNFMLNINGTPQTSFFCRHTVQKPPKFEQELLIRKRFAGLSAGIRFDLKCTNYGKLSKNDMTGRNNPPTMKEFDAFPSGPYRGDFSSNRHLSFKGCMWFYLKGVSSPDSFLQCGYTWNLKWREGIFITREEFWAWGMCAKVCWKILRL